MRENMFIYRDILLNGMVYDKQAYERRKQKLGPDEMRARWREYRRSNSSEDYREKARVRGRKWRKLQLEINPNFKEYQNKQHRDKAKEKRYECIKHYSKGKMNCNCCSEHMYMFLEIDHKNDNGNKHRESIPNMNIYRWLINNNFPEEYQVLCSNCNKGKHFNGGICPHQDSDEGKPGTYA